jgi:hypothetical protein
VSLITRRSCSRREDQERWSSTDLPGRSSPDQKISAPKTMSRDDSADSTPIVHLAVDPRFDPSAFLLSRLAYLSLVSIHNL